MLRGLQMSSPGSCRRHARRSRLGLGAVSASGGDRRGRVRKEVAPYPSDWMGGCFSEGVVRTWRGLGIPHQEAGRWARAGFSPWQAEFADIVLAYDSLTGVEEVDAVERWRGRGIPAWWV